MSKQTNYLCSVLIFPTEIGDPVEDLAVATVLMVVGGQLILLRPRKVSESYFEDNMILY